MERLKKTAASSSEFFTSETNKMNTGTEKLDSNARNDTTAHTVKNWHVVANKSQFDYFMVAHAAIAGRQL